MYSVRKLKKYDIRSLAKVSDILYKCGKDMAKKQDLHHWDNGHIKNWAIVALCALKNDIYLVYSEKTAVATFQLRKTENAMLFQKLATSPAFAGKGTGSFCLSRIEEIAQRENCGQVVCEVYDQSNHAIDFYAHRGYRVYGTTLTRKYTELKMRKEF